MDESTTHPEGQSTRPLKAETTSRSRWPGVLGGLAVAFAVLGLLAGILSVVASLSMDFRLAAVPVMPGADPADLARLQAIRTVLGEWAGVLVSMQLVRTALAVMLLVGGIQLVQRKRTSLRTLRIWAVLQLIAVTARMVTGLLVLDRLGASSSVLIVVLALGFSFVLVCPVFVLIWFRRAPIRREVEVWL